MSGAADTLSVSGVMDRLRPRNRARRWIEQMIAAGGPTDEEFARLRQMARDPANWQWRERAAVCWYIGSLELDGERRSVAAEALADALTRGEEGLPDRVGRLALRSLAVTTVLTTCQMVATGLAGAEVEVLAPLLRALFGAIPMMLLVWPFHTVVERARLDWVRHHAAAGLSQVPEPALLHRVLKAVRDPKDLVRRPAWQAACAMLRATSPEHYGQLGAAVPDLCQLLRHSAPETQAFLVGALGRFADGRAVEPIERLLQRPGLAPEVRTAAENALPVLRLRREQEGADARLLRPAANPEDGSTLLRPAANAGPSDEELLLRPSEGEAE